MNLIVKFVKLNYVQSFRVIWIIFFTVQNMYMYKIHVYNWLWQTRYYARKQIYDTKHFYLWLKYRFWQEVSFPLEVIMYTVSQSARNWMLLKMQQLRLHLICLVKILYSFKSIYNNDFSIYSLSVFVDYSGYVQRK